MELNDTLIRNHRNNLRRYRRLLATELTELERNYLLRRIGEEEQALFRLLQSGSGRNLRGRPLKQKTTSPDRGHDLHMRAISTHTNRLTTATTGERHGYA